MPEPTERDDDSTLERCERVLGYRFRNPALLRGALTHASGADHRLASNERLEFLGDAILGAVICEQLYREFPESLEGGLTRIKSIVVSRRTCAKVSRRLGLDEFLVLGKGMGTPDQTPDSVLSDVFESLVGAIYLDGGMDAAAPFIRRHLDPEIAEAAADDRGQNYKSILQQASQRQFGETPTYLLLDEKGPDHSKCFKMAAAIGPRRFAAAWGPNKKDAEQRAARNALAEIAGEPAPYPSD
jgi:ribonuclease-3